MADKKKPKALDFSSFDSVLTEVKEQDESKQAVIEGRPKSGYDGVPDEWLNPLQKAEKFAQKMWLISPGEEWFSPDKIEHTKKYAEALSPMVPAGMGVGAVKGAGSGIGIIAGLAKKAAAKAVPAAAKGTKELAKYGAGYLVGDAIARRLFGNK
jgi:hypothetical protein